MKAGRPGRASRWYEIFGWHGHRSPPRSWRRSRPDVLAGFVLARAAAGLADGMIASDVMHLEQVRALAENLLLLRLDFLRRALGVPSGRRAAQAGPAGLDDGLRAMGDLHFREDSRHIVADCGRAEHQSPRDVGVAVAGRDQFKYFRLALG
jgi:hypothetical protein